MFDPYQQQNRLKQKMSLSRALGQESLDSHSDRTSTENHFKGSRHHRESHTSGSPDGFLLESLPPTASMLSKGAVVWVSVSKKVTMLKVRIPPHGTIEKWWDLLEVGIDGMR